MIDSGVDEGSVKASPTEDSVQVSMRELRQMELARQQKDEARRAWRRREAERLREEAARRQALAVSREAAERRRLELDQAERERLRAEREHLEAVTSKRDAEVRLAELELALLRSRQGGEPADLRPHRRGLGIVVIAAALLLLQLLWLTGGDDDARFRALVGELTAIEARLDDVEASARMSLATREELSAVVAPAPVTKPPAATGPRPRPRPHPRPTRLPAAGPVVLDCDVNSPLCN